MTGKLYIVATPIGNLADISERAVETLKQVDRIAAEDTRHSKTLLQHFGINTPCSAYHEHNEATVTDELIQELAAGKSIALISDAGTPLINDPGYKLVAAAHGQNIPVTPVPGPSALITALSAAGLATSRFVFEGYLPPKKEARRKYLEELQHESRTMIFYEAPHRIKESINAMHDVFGENTTITIARELTKQFEQIVRDTLNNIKNKLENEEIKIKGEFVVIVEGQNEIQTDDAEVIRINTILSEKLSPKEAAALTAKITGRKKNEVYKLGLKQTQ